GRGNGTAEAGGRRTRALAEGEDVEVGERQRANQVERGAVIRVRLPREPGDHVRPETEDGEPLRQPFEPRPVRLGGVPVPPHALEQDRKSTRLNSSHVSI